MGPDAGYTAPIVFHTRRLDSYYGRAFAGSELR